MVHMPTTPPPGAGESSSSQRPEKPNQPYSSKTSAKEPEWEKHWKDLGYTDQQIKQFENGMLRTVNDAIKKDNDKAVKALRKMREENQDQD